MDDWILNGVQKIMSSITFSPDILTSLLSNAFILFLIGYIIRRGDTRITTLDDKKADEAQCLLKHKGVEKDLKRGEKKFEAIMETQEVIKAHLSDQSQYIALMRQSIEAIEKHIEEEVNINKKGSGD